MFDCKQDKLKENLFISRLRENLSVVENAGGLQEGDRLAELRKLTGGKLLRNELEARFPLGKSVSTRITPKGKLFGKETLPIVLAGKVIIRLERFVEKECDDESVSLSELNTILNRESDLANRGRFECVLGLFSPTGWADDSRQFIENSPPGTGWASNRVYPILIGPEITGLVWNKKSSTLSKYIQCFCGLTPAEREQICESEIRQAILVKEFANLEQIAEARCFALEFVKSIAKKLEADSKELSLKKVPGVGLVLKKRI